MTRVPRHPSLADRADAVRRDQPQRVIGGTSDRGILTAVIHEPAPDDARAATRYVTAHARDADDCWFLLAALGLIADDGRDLP